MEKPAHKLESGQYIIGPVGLAMSGVFLILSRVAKMPLYGPGAQVVNHSIVRLDIKCYFAKVPESGYVVRPSDIVRACEIAEEEIKGRFLPNWGESPISFHYDILEAIVDGQVTLNATLTIGDPAILRKTFIGEYHNRPPRRTSRYQEEGDK